MLDSSQSPPFGDIVGWTVSGRHGHLGHVIQADAEGDRAEDAQQLLLVRGGASQALYFHVPVEFVVRLGRRGRILTIDADVSDFTPHLRPDGSVDLFPRAR